jgi:hypothetical protein
VGRLHGSHDAQASGPSQIAGVHALEVLDPMRNRRSRSFLQQVERSPHGGIADRVHGRRNSRPTGGLDSVARMLEG